MVVFDDDLTPAQLRNIEKELEIYNLFVSIYGKKVSFKNVKHFIIEL